MVLYGQPTLQHFFFLQNRIRIFRNSKNGQMCFNLHLWFDASALRLSYTTKTSELPILFIVSTLFCCIQNLILVSIFWQNWITAQTSELVQAFMYRLRSYNPIYFWKLMVKKLQRKHQLRWHRNSLVSLVIIWLSKQIKADVGRH